MDLATHLFHDPHDLNEMMDGIPYPSRRTHSSELSDALGGITLHQPESDWTDWGYIAPHQPPSHDIPLYPPQAAASTSTLIHQGPYESNSGAPPGFHGPADPSACNLGNPNYIEQTPTPLCTTIWDSNPGGYCGNSNLVASWRVDNTNNSYDFSPQPLFHLVSQIHGSAYDFIQSGANNLSSPWTATAQAQYTSKSMEPEPQPHQTEEFSVEHFQETDRDSDLLLPRIPSSCTTGPPPQTTFPSRVQSNLDDAAEVHKHMRRRTGGGATCAWEHGGGECGYSSHVDLVKQHIKRVHYRLKPCACKYCDRRFFNNYALSLHNNTHTGRKPFTCEICGKGFASPSGKSHHRIIRHKHQIRNPSMGQYVRWVNVPFERRGETSAAVGKTETA